MPNALADEYRRRIDWIEHQFLEMADEQGKILKSDAERVIFQHYRCSRYSVARYFETLQGAGIITMNSVELIVEVKKKK